MRWKVRQATLFHILLLISMCNSLIASASLARFIQKCIVRWELLVQRIQIKGPVQPANENFWSSSVMNAWQEPAICAQEVTYVEEADELLALVDRVPVIGDKRAADAAYNRFHCIVSSRCPIRLAS